MTTRQLALQAMRSSAWRGQGRCNSQIYARRHASTAPPTQQRESPIDDVIRPAGSSPRQQPPAPSPRGGGRPVVYALLLSLVGAASYALGSAYPPESVTLLYPRPQPPVPLPLTPEATAYLDKLERDMLSLPHVRQLLNSSSKRSSAAPDAAATDGNDVARHYLLSRPFAKLPAQMTAHSLTGGSLRKPGMLAVPPVVVSKTRHGAAALGGHQGDAFAYIHLGRSLCGHDRIVHGGLLATILDETLARNAFFHLPHHVGVTAHLEIDYKRPVRADSVVEIETKLIEAEGRKAWVEATMRDLHGHTLVVSKALFVEPRLVAWLDTSAVHHIMDRTDE